jgi:hypothetical protein
VIAVRATSGGFPGGARFPFSPQRQWSQAGWEQVGLALAVPAGELKLFTDYSDNTS